MQEPQEKMEIGAENVNDVVVLLGWMKQMNLPALLDHHINRHGNEEG